MSQWDRYVRVEVGIPGQSGVAWSSPMHIEFDITRTSAGHEPDAATVRIFNVAEDHKPLRAGDDTYVRILAGYGHAGDAALLFEGEITDVETVRQGVDLVTTIEAGDGASALLSGGGHVAMSFDAESPVQMAIDAVASRIGVSVEAIEDLPVVQAAQGLSFDDTVDRVFDGLVGEFTRATGRDYEWSLHGGVLLIGPSTATVGRAPHIAPRTGLVGSPKAIDGGVEFRSLLNPLLVPRGAVELESRDFSGVYKVTQVRHVGSSYGGDFYSDVETEFLSKVTR